ncbi:MAG: phosphotransferase [Pseudobacteriovorax sp.]|nr:phosphotransferase [Pseudobacteriovorax sp.]
MIASVARGATALTKSGGVKAHFVKQRMIRAPYFTLLDLNEAKRFAEWIVDQKSVCETLIRSVSRHARLKEISTNILGRSVHVAFIYTTGKAAGQNMSTVCTWKICKWIETVLADSQTIKLEGFSLEGNLSGDKKVTSRSFVEGRGTQVAAEAFIPQDILNSVLKVSSAKLLDAYRHGQSGANCAGMIGFNINVANVVAAMFIAAGQDVACVHESSLAQFDLREGVGGIHASMMMPSLIVGTVGGGTGLPAQKEALKLMGCEGVDSAKKLAEIIVSYALALDLSTLSAIANDTFAAAHDRLGRNRPVDYLSKSRLTKDYFSKQLSQYKGRPIEVMDVQIQHDLLGHSILTEQTAKENQRKFIGLLPLYLKYRDGTKTVETQMVIKSKPKAEEVMLMMSKIAAICGEDVSQKFSQVTSLLGFDQTDAKEVEVYRLKSRMLSQLRPMVHAIHFDKDKEISLLMMDDLSTYSAFNKTNDKSEWTISRIKSAIGAIAKFHADFRGKTESLPHILQKPKLTQKDRRNRSDWLKAVFRMSHLSFDGWFDQDMSIFFERIADTSEKTSYNFGSEHLSLIHNDFSPRNSCFHPQTNQLCVYDWELATVDHPLRDVVEMLIFTLNDDMDRNDIENLLMVHYETLEADADAKLNPVSYRKAYIACLHEYAVSRLPLYLMGHQAQEYEFLPSVVKNLKTLIQWENKAGGDL